MIKIQVIKLESSGIQCDNKDCKKNPEYLYNIIGSVHHIRKNTTVAIVSVGNGSEVYCRDCIDDVYHIAKTTLDSKLWVFK